MEREWHATRVPTGTGATGATQYVYDYADSNEPAGILVNTYTPLGYEHTISYYSSAQSDNFGLPTSVTGASITQSDGSVRTPTQTFAYDNFGNLTAYNAGNGAWSLTYDTLNRMLTRSDPDSVTSYSCYNVDGSVAYTESAYQRSLDGTSGCQSTAPAYAVSQLYDADGNVVQQTHHYGQTPGGSVTPGVTQKWYDGDDRLIEVKQPQDPTDVYVFPWLTRYIYDLSENQPVSITGGATVNAYGNLYKTQECLQATSVQVAGPFAGKPSGSPTVTGTCTSFLDVRGNSFDPLDRGLNKYEVAAGSAPETTSTYDTNGNLGLLSEKTTATGQTDTLAYDADGHLANEAFNDGITSNRSFGYDPDGHQTSLTSTAVGTQTRTYDANGRLVGTTDPSGLSDPGSVTYTYYPDGMRQALGLSIPALNFSQSTLFAYNYRADGKPSSLVSAIGYGNKTFAWTYTAAGRELTQSDPLTGANADTTDGVNLVPETYTYDSYGRATTLQLPRQLNQLQSFTYDAEGNALNFQTGVTPYPYVYTTRNETWGPNSYGQDANGAQCTQGTSCTMDSRSNQLLSDTEFYTPPGGSTVTATHTYSYDPAGRETNDASQTCNGSGAIARTYDTDNHIAQMTVSGSYDAGLTTYNCGNLSSTAYTTTYSWAADGHLATLSNTAGTEAAHWDGDDLLYVSGQPLYPLTIYVGKLGFAAQNASGTWITSVYDRDWSGTTINEHFSLATPFGSETAAFSALNINRPYTACTSGNPKCGTASSQPAGGGPSNAGGTPPQLTLDAQRNDGYYDGTNAFQGVGVYDPSANQWTTPDAYAGDVHDPMSQKPYMWNDNNPMAYDDPSGYCIVDLCIGEGIAVGIGIGDLLGILAGGAAGAGGAVLHSNFKEAQASTKSPKPEAGPGPTEGKSHDDSRLPRTGSPGNRYETGR